MMKKIILRTICILGFGLWWIVFPIGMIGIWINGWDTNLKYNWNCYWESIVDGWNDNY